MYRKKNKQAERCGKCTLPEKTILPHCKCDRTGRTFGVAAVSRNDTPNLPDDGRMQYAPTPDNAIIAQHPRRYTGGDVGAYGIRPDGRSWYYCIFGIHSVRNESLGRNIMPHRNLHSGGMHPATERCIPDGMQGLVLLHFLPSDAFLTECLSGFLRRHFSDSFAPCGAGRTTVRNLLDCFVVPPRNDAGEKVMHRQSGRRTGQMTFGQEQMTFGEMNAGRACRDRANEVEPRPNPGPAALQMRQISDPSCRICNSAVVSISIYNAKNKQ